MSTSKKKNKKNGNYIPTEEDKANGVFSYASHTVIYANDYACNAALDVFRMLDSANYKGNAVKKVCGALQKRVNAYFDNFNTMFNEALYEIAEYNGNIDDVCDIHFFEFKRIMSEELSKRGVERSEFIAAVEACRCAFEVASQVCDYMCEKLKPYTNAWVNLSKLNLKEIAKVADSLSNIVYSIIPNGIQINLTDIPELEDAFNNWSVAMFEYKNYKRAFRKTYKNK